MLINSKLAMSFWAESVNAACYVLNKCVIKSLIKKTPYELINDKKPSIAHLKPFGCNYFVLNNVKDDLGIFDARSDEGVFLGYLLSSKAYRVFNKRTKCVEESVHVKFYEGRTKDKKWDKDELEEFTTDRKIIQESEEPQDESTDGPDPLNSYKDT